MHPFYLISTLILFWATNKAEKGDVVQLPGRQAYYACPTDMTLANATFSSGSDLYQAANTITTGNNFLVNNSAQLSLKAGYMIEMNPDFTVEPGSGGQYVAEIVACPPVTPTPSAISEIVDAPVCALEIYPNPASGQQAVLLFPETATTQPSSITITDAFGRVLFQKQNVQQRRFLLPVLPPVNGIAYITVQNAVCRKTLKLVKSH